MHTLKIPGKGMYKQEVKAKANKLPPRACKHATKHTKPLSKG